MKRSPLERKSPMKRTRSRPAKSKTKYARRERDFVYMGWVKQQPCCLMILSMAQMMTPIPGWKPSDSLASWVGGLIVECDGATEAHHAGERAGWRKADDSTVVPLCVKHHRRLTDRRGEFSGWPKGALKVWELATVAYYSARYAENRDSDGESPF